MKTRHIIIILIFVLINVGVVMTLNFGGKEVEEKKETDFIPTLSALSVENVEENFNIEGYGTISSFHSVDVSCEVQGKMIKGNKNLKPGVKFKKGELLFKVNDTEARYNLRARKSSYINIIANLLPDIKLDFNSEYDKWNDYINAIKLNESLPTLPKWNSTKEKIFLSTRNVLTEYFAIKSLEEQLQKYYVRAPFNGVITEVYISDFSIVNPGAKILKIVQTGNFEIPVSIPVSQLNSVEVGSMVNVYSTSGKLKGSGSVIRISEVINKNTQSVDVYVRPQALEGVKFIEGEYVKVEVIQKNENKGIRIPANAVKGGEVKIYSKGDSTLTTKKVNVLNENERGIFVEGLQDNDILITQEVLNFTDTSKYQVVIK